MNEETLVKTMELPRGQDWEWYGDLNMIVLAPHLCPEGRDRAISEVQKHWRRSCLRVVDEVNVTQPLASLPPLAV